MQVAGHQQQCSKTSWLQEACTGACTLCCMQGRSMAFPGMREALCHSLCRRRGLLWLRFLCGGQHVPPALLWNGAPSATCPSREEGTSMASCCLKHKGPEKNKFWGNVVKAVEYLGYPSNIQPMTLAPCSEGFSAQEVLTEYFFDWQSV